MENRELAAVLAGLRLLICYQEETQPNEWGIGDILSNGGEVRPMHPDEIDRLCERLNNGDTRLAVDNANTQADRDGWKKLALEYRQTIAELTGTVVRQSDLLYQLQSGQE